MSQKAQPLHGEFARFRLKKFFCDIELELNNQFQELEREEKTGIAKKLPQMMVKLRERNTHNPFIDLYIASSEWCVSDWEDNDQDEIEEELSMTDGDAQLEIIFQKLASLAIEIRETVEKLAVGVAIDIDELIERIHHSFDMGADLRQKTQMAASSVGIQFNSWCTEEEFIETVALIRDRMETQTSAQLLEFYNGLEQLLATIQIDHRSKATRLKWEDQKGAAHAQLKEVISSNLIDDLPRCTELDSKEWFEWVMSLNDAPLEEVIEKINKVLPSLGQLLSEIEPHHIEFKVMDKETDATDSESGESIQEVTPASASETAVEVEREEAVAVPEEEIVDQAETVAEEIECVPDIKATIDEPQLEPAMVASAEPEIVEADFEPLPEEEAIDDPVDESATVESLAEAIEVVEDKVPTNWATHPVELRGMYPSADLAYKILKEKTFDGPLAVNLVSALIAEKNYSAAWNASCLLKLNGGQPPVHEILLKALTLASYVNYSDGEMASAISELISKEENSLYFIPLEDLAIDHHVASFLLIATCLRPALIAPQTDAAAMLQQLRLIGDTDGLYNLIQSVSEFGSQHRPLDMHTLKKSMSQAVWQEELKNAKENATRWLEDAYDYKIKYIPAKKVWRNWLETNGFIQRAVALVSAGDISRLDQINSELKRLSDSSKIDNEIDRTDDSLRTARNSSSTNIDFQARQAIHNFTAEACALLRRFITVSENKPGADRNNFNTQLVDKLRDGFKQYLEPARSCLGNIIKRDRGLLGIAAQACLDAINDVALFFDPETPGSFTEPSPKHILYRQSLFTLDWETYDNWQPKFSNIKEGIDPLKAIEAFLNSLINGQVTLDQCFEIATERKNHTATERIIEVLDAEGETEKGDQMRLSRTSKLTDCRKGLRVSIDDIVKHVGESFNYGCIDEPLYNQIMARMSSMQGAIESITDFATCESEINQVREKIAELAKAESTSIAARFEALDLSPGSNMFKLITKKMVERDYAMASELIQRAAEGEEIPSEETKFDVFRDFSTRRFQLIEKYLENNKAMAPLVASLKSGILQEDLGRRIADGDRAAKIFEAYQYAGRKGQFTSIDDVKNALTVLGFEIISFNKTTDTKVYNLKVSPIADRSVCPIAMYGSKANGSYKVILLYGTVFEDQILAEVTKSKDGPIIVLIFGTLVEARRRKLAKICRERAKTFLVLDNILVYAAATSEIPPLAAMFRLAIPWTFYKPYSEGGGAIPVETFYGRESEISSIVGNGENSTAFIYGGRQLGKTALLNMVAKQFHNGLNNIAVYIDLVALGIGRALSLDHLWVILSREFKKHGVLRENDTVGREGKELHFIEQWLDDDQSRRILLFLDEADWFLNEDGKDHFRITGKLKELKEKTHGRFRIVFSGLHNVKRTTHAKNDPLLQLGKATCIGPMLSTGDRRDATRLIEEPMAACGYLFESRELVWRVMALSLYSPSLIQIFCSKIMNHINANLPAYDRQPQSAPPYIISERDVNDAYRFQEIRDDIIYRFNKTITLDDRYEVIACIIALDMLDNQGKKSIYDATWLRGQSQKAWAKGFDQYHGSLDAFTVLLKEMEGLGVLLCKDNQYSFRTSSIATMLGTMEEIMDRLWKDRPEPVPYTPDIFRPVVDRNNTVKCAPLSVIELGGICNAENGVIVILGTPASGIDSLAKSIEAFGQTYIIRFSEITKHSDFETRLTEELKKKPRSGTTIIYVESTNRWDDNWILSARKKVKNKTSDTSFLKVLFEGKPTNIDYLVKHEQTLPLNSQTDSLLRCLPWHRDMVGTWAETNSNGPNHGPRQENLNLLMETSGGWPELLYEFHEADDMYPGQWKEKLKEICSFKTPAQRTKMMTAFGMTKSPFDLRYYAVLAEFEKATADEICALVDDSSKDEVALALRWAYLAGLAAVDPGGIYIIDPVVGRLLRESVKTDGQ